MVYQDFPVQPNECELMARFAYYLIVKDFHQNPRRYENPSAAIKALRDRFAPADEMMLDIFLCAYQYLVARGVSLRFARTAMIERARKGLDFRSVVFVDYKAARRRDPRVTNRGVRGRDTKEGQK